MLTSDNYSGYLMSTYLEPSDRAAAAAAGQAD
jgi:hypothetical protein